MKILGYSISKANEKPVHASVANFLKDRERQDKLKKVVVELVQQTMALTKKDIAAWRSAWQRALSVEYPNRVELYSIYRDIEMDGHLRGVFGQIFNEVLQKEFKIVDRHSGTELPELTKQIEDAQWFINFCELALQSVPNGYSLIQFDDVVVINEIMKFKDCELIQREHVIPEHEVFVRNMGDHYTQGIKYTEPPYSSWVIGVGKKNDLGLYNVVARHAISKKNVEAFWDKFAEIFGMPIRIGKTNSTNQKDRNEMAEMLQKMGSAAWGMFNDDSDIEIKETTRGDAYEVYDKRIDRANSEMSKAIVNQTMTTDNGSSKAQGTVHLEIQGYVIEYFARLLRIVINDRLIPFMVMHGFKGWENAKFRYDDTIELTPEEQKNVEEMLLGKFDIDPKYFIDKYNIPITEKKVDPTPPKNPLNKTGFFD